MRTNFLRRNATANDNKGDEGANDEDSGAPVDENLDGYEDDYALNRAANRSNPGNRSAPAPRNRHSSPIPEHDGYQAQSRDHPSRSAPNHSNRDTSPAHDGYDEQRNRSDPTPKPSSNTRRQAPHQPDTTANSRDIRRADKIVAMEEEREQGAKAGPSNKPSKPATIAKSAKAKGKQPERQDPQVS